MEWDPPLEEDRNGVITKYQIKVEWNVNQVHQIETVFVNNYVVTGLEPNTRYYYSVAAYTKVGMGPYSNKTAVTTKMQSTIPYSNRTDTTTAIEKEPLANMTDAATGSQSTHDRIVFSYCYSLFITFLGALYVSLGGAFILILLMVILLVTVVLVIIKFKKAKTVR